MDQSFIKSDSVVVNYVDDALGKVALHLVGFVFKVKLKHLKSLTPKHDDEDLICTKWCSLDDVEIDEMTPFLQELLIDNNSY